MKSTPIVFLFNSPLQSGCDYVVQTMRIIGTTNPTYGLALGDIIWFPKLFTERRPWVSRRIEGAVILRPVSIIPGVRFRPVRILAYLLQAVLIRIFVAIRHPKLPKVLWFFEPFHIPPLLHIFSDYTSLYDCVDYYPGFNPGARAEHRACMDTASYVIANSKPLAAMLRRIRSDVVSVPLGSSTSLFKNYRISPLPPKKENVTVGYIGGISSRIDFSLLATVIQRLPRVRFLFVGPPESNVFGKSDHSLHAMRILSAYHNVEWIQGVPKKDIPAVLSRVDIGIVPYRSNLSFNRYSFPMKVMEYFACGKPVVSTDIYSLRGYTDAQILAIASTPETFAREIRLIQRNGWQESKQKKQVSIAISMSWQEKIKAIMTATSLNT